MPVNSAFKSDVLNLKKGGKPLTLNPRQLIKKIPGFNRLNEKRWDLEEYCNLFAHFVYDFKKFQRNYSYIRKYKDQKALSYWILQDAHRVEKALSLPETRLGFGEWAISRLISYLVQYAKRFGKDDVYYVGIGALKAYEDFHQGKLPDFFVRLFPAEFEQDLLSDKCELSGTAPVSQPLVEPTFAELASNRHSCRNFDTKREVPAELLAKIVPIVMRTPSVCNRQHWRLHVLTGEAKRKFLSLQNGNNGFTDNIPYIAVVTSDMKAFYTAEERTQAYTDGGMFAMSLIYAFESSGIKSCPLNWCVSPEKDQAMYQFGIVPNNETVIMLIAFGYGNDKGEYAKSPRLPESTFLTTHTE